MKYTQEYRTKRLKEMADVVSHKDFDIPYEAKLAYREKVKKDIEKYHEYCKVNNIDPTTYEEKVTDEQLKRRFDC